MPSSPLTTCWGSTIEKNLVKNIYLLKMDLCLDTWSRCTHCWQAGPLWLCLHRWWVLWRRGWWQSSVQTAAGRWQPVTEWQLLPKPERKQIKCILRCELQRRKCLKKCITHKYLQKYLWASTLMNNNVLKNSSTEHALHAPAVSAALETGYQCYGCMLYWEAKTENPQKDMVSWNSLKIWGVRRVQNSVSTILIHTFLYESTPVILLIAVKDIETNFRDPISTKECLAVCLR